MVGDANAVFQALANGGKARAERRALSLTQKLAFARLMTEARKALSSWEWCVLTDDLCQHDMLREFDRLTEEARTKGCPTIDVKKLGMSDLSTVVGVNPWQKPIDLWQRITTGKSEPASLAMEFGHHAEPFLIRQWEGVTGGKSKGPRLMEIPGKSFLRCNLDADAELQGQGVVVDAKTSSFRMARAWGDGEDEVPHHVQCQMQGYLWATGYERCDVVALIGGADLRLYTLKPDAHLQGMLLEAAERFWVDYVQTGKPPPVDGSDSYREWLSDKYPTHKGEVMRADAEMEGLFMELSREARTLGLAEAHLELLRNRIKERLGDAAGAEGAFGKCSWRQNKATKRTDWEAVAAHFNPEPELIQQHTTEKPGPRVFRISYAKGAIQ